MNRLQRREACLDKQLHFSLITKAGNHPAVPRRIESRQQQSSRLYKLTFKLHLFLEQFRPVGLRRSVGNARPPVQIRDPRLGRSEEHTSELQSLAYLVCRLLLEKKKKATGLSQYSAAVVSCCRV